MPRPMVDSAKRPRISIDVPLIVRRRLRLAAARRDLSVRQYLLEAIEARLREDLGDDGEEAIALTAKTDPVLAELWDKPRFCEPSSKQWSAGNSVRCRNRTWTPSTENFAAAWGCDVWWMANLMPARRMGMAPDRDTLVGLLREIVLSSASRNAKLQNIASIIKASGNYRWVGLYTVDRQAGQVINLVWSGPGAPEYPAFPIGKGLTGAAIVQRRTINVGDVAGDPCYLTAFGSTRSEIIVPVFDEARENVVGTIDLESEQANAFGADEQTLLEVCSEVIQPLWRS